MAVAVAPFDPFQALGLERDALPGDIKARYHELARRYHPNRHQGSDDSKAALSEYFHHIYQAWDLLRDPAKRARYVELLNLYDLHETILAGAADLFASNDPHDQNVEEHKHHSDSQVSSDADDDDDDLPRLAGISKRETFDQKRPRKSSLHSVPEASDSDSHTSKERPSRSRLNQLRSTRSRVDSGRDSDGSDQNVAAERRRKYDQLRRKELEAFETYRDAMIAKFEAEEKAERCKELFDRAAWRRQYFERAPKETSQRMRLIRLFNAATKAFTAQQEPVKRRKGSTVSAGGQILSTGDPFQGNQFLSLPSRTKSIRRQGFSSDISVDQTSSDEDYSSDKASSPKRNTRASSPAPNHRRHRSGDLIPTALNTAPRRLPNADQDPISPITGPGPRVIVRTATNLHEMLHEAPSDAEKPSASSRSPSPAVCRSRSLSRGRFKLLPHTSTSELFGSSSDRRGRSPSADRHATAAHMPQHSSSESFLFGIKHVRQLRHSNIPIENVHELRRKEKEAMLTVDADAEANPDQLLKALSGLDKHVAEKFVVKPDIKKDFNFRLIYSHREGVKLHHQSFIALSYRRKLHVEKKQKHFTLPLDADMFQAVWDERISDREGVWIDQVCIRQDSEDEKTTSMSAMDMVYHSARLVVVVLDDIALEAHDGAVLEAHMREFESDGQSHIPANKRYRRRPKPWLEAKEDLYNVIRKLLKSSWFRRAWCRHEMRLARDHIFLVPCRSPGSWSGRSVLRFSGKCLTHLLGLAIEVAFDPTIEAVKPALYAFFRDRSKLSHEHHLRSHHGNFTTVVAEVFAMEAGGDPNIPEAQRESDARKDKISIILNTMECGLSLHPRVRRPAVSLPTTECNYMLLLLALAARDPGALCSVGHSFRELPYNLSSTWMLEATNVDAGLNNYRTLNRLPELYPITTHTRHGENYVQLHLKFFGGNTVLRASELPDSLRLARHFMDVSERRKLGRNRKRYLLNDRTANQLFGSMLDVYVETLVCVFHCGPDWMSEVCQRYGVSRWKYDLQPAYDLLIAFKNTHGLWPDHAWSQQAAGFLMDFVNFLVIRGMPQRQIMEPQPWRPVCVDTPNGGNVLTFTPPGTLRVAMPAAMSDADYLHLARMWILEPRGEYDENELAHYHEWTLLGKSVLFTDETATALVEAPSARIRGGQKVFGRLAQWRLAV